MIHTTFTNFKDVQDLVKKVYAVTLCHGTGIGDKTGRNCNVENTRNNTRHCLSCALFRKNFLKNLFRSVFIVKSLRPNKEKLKRTMYF